MPNRSASLLAILLNLDCVKGAFGDCAAVFECLAPDGAEPSCTPDDNFCSDSTHIQLCTLASDQSTPVLLEVDCARLGMQCQVYHDQPLCALPGPEEYSDTNSCAGDVALYEGASVTLGSDCSLEGGTCRVVDYDGDDLPCVGTGSACELGENSVCRGDKLIGCLNGKKATVDCTRTWRVCRTDPWDLSGADHCLFRECDAHEDPETCAGTKLRYCGINGWTEVDCQDLGFASCHEDSYGYAACTN